VSGPRRSLLNALHERVLVADGAMGTMLHAAEPTLDDYQGHEGCSEILSVTRPDVVQGIHEALSIRRSPRPEPAAPETNLSGRDGDFIMHFLQLRLGMLCLFGFGLSCTPSRGASVRLSR